MNNIILYVKNLKGRGVQKVYLNLAKGFINKGYNVYFVIRENKIDFDIDFLKNFYIFEKNFTKQFDNLLSTLNNPYIIANDVKTTLNLKNVIPNNIIYTIHMLWSKRIIKKLRFKKWWELKKLYFNKNIVTVSKAVENDIVNILKLKPKNIKTIYDPFDVNEIIKLSNEKINISYPYIINVGALEKEKNHKFLIKSFSKLKIPHKLVIIGDGSLKENLIKYTKKLHLEHKVIFLGFVKNPYPYIKNASLMVSTSKDEALPGSIIESLILKTPVVSTDSEGVKEILVNELQPYIFKSSTNFENLILQALNNYPIILDKYINKFDIETVTNHYIHYLKELND